MISLKLVKVMCAKKARTQEIKSATMGRCLAKTLEKSAIGL